jgi:hypothetical protein
MQLSRAEIKLYTISAGLPDLFVDIAMAESSGRTDVVNSIGCVGLWQINQPVHVKAHPSWTRTWLQNPGNNARAAKVLYSQSGTAPWVSSKAKWGGAAGAGNSDGLQWSDIPGADAVSGAVDTVGDVAGGVSLIADGVAKTATWVSKPSNWVRVGYVVGGGVLVVAGVGMITKLPTALAGTAIRRVMPS